MSDLMKVSSNPHIRSKLTTNTIMAAVIIALLPATGFGIYNFGIPALILILVTVASTVLTEFLYEKLMKKPVTIGDFSAVVTGLLLALNLRCTLVDRGDRWCFCHFDCENVIWRFGTELHEPCSWCKMFPDAFLYVHYDKL